jgi:small-conductance mechanosensitive channel/CRP-like cAMP-binding protein
MTPGAGGSILGAMGYWSAIAREVWDEHTLYLLAALAAMWVLVHLVAPDERRRLRGTAVLVFLHVALLPIAGVLHAKEIAAYREVRLAALVFSAIAFIRLASLLLFGVLLPRARLVVPRILREILAAGASVIAIFVLASRLGLNLSGIIATSAVLTAVVGLSLQDTLTNIMAGLSLQMDHSVQVGDWIKLGDLSGVVTEVRWRSTRIETRNWETLIVPNSHLVRNQFMIQGKRSGQPRQWRRWVYFNVDFRFAPTEVIATVGAALQAVVIPSVATEPAPNCVCMDLHDSYARYAVRYWLTDLAADDPTDSEVRTRIYFALRRSGLPLSIPAQAVFVTEDTSERKADKLHADHDRRLSALRHVGFFDHLSDGERAHLAECLHYTPYAHGEVMTRQGAPGHWLYLVVKGEAAVRVEAEGLEREVARLGAGTFFGEMSLMTGEPRTATVIALSDVECYRLEKDAFQAILSARPDLAEGVAEVLARRRAGLAVAKDHLDAAAEERRVAADKNHLLGRIRSFFGLRETPSS